MAATRRPTTRKSTAKKANRRPVDRSWIRAAQEFGGKNYLRGYDCEPMQLTAAGENEQKLPIMSGTAYSGGLLNVGYGWPVVMDLAGTSVMDQRLPVHREHDTNRLVGHTESIDLAAKNIKFTGVISGTRDDAIEVRDTAKNGFPWRPSIGASFQKLEYVDRGQTVKVNGRNFSGPIYIARGATLRELSVVTVPGDDKSDAAIAAKHQESVMNEFELWLQANGWDHSTLTDAQRKVLQASFKAAQKAKELEVELEDDEEGGEITAIHRTGKRKPAVAAPVIDENKIYANFEGRFLKTQARVSAIRAAFGGEHADEEAKAIADPNYTAEKAELFVLRASRPKAPNLSGDNPDFDEQTIHCALARSQGVKEKHLEACFGKVAVDRTRSSKYEGFGVQSILDLQMTAAGKSWSGSRRSTAFLTEARAAELKLKASGFATTSLSNALQATVRALLLDSYSAIPQTWRHFAGIRSHNDFKINKYYRMDAGGGVREVGPDGQLPSLTLSASEYTNQLKTFGGTIVLTRQDKINDDLGLMGQLPRIIGRAFSQRIDESVYKALLALFASGSFFTTAKGNKKTGGGSALSYTALSAAKQAFLSLLDANAKPINAYASRMTVPTALDQIADDLFTSENLAITGSTDAVKTQKNGHKGKFSPVSSTYIDNTNIRDQDGRALSSQTSTGWLLHGDPEIGAAVLYVAFLNGQEIPTVQEAITPSDILGEAVQFFHDWGVGNGDEYSGVYSAGA